MNTSPMRALLLLACLATGCTQYTAINGPPPGSVASLRGNDQELKLSQGVALGFTCSTPGGNPCSKSARIKDPKIAKVMPAHLAKLERFISGTLPQSTYVVIGLEPGTTQLLIEDEDPVQVTVLPR